MRLDPLNTVAGLNVHVVVKCLSITPVVREGARLV